MFVSINRRNYANCIVRKTLNITFCCKISQTNLGTAYAQLKPLTHSWFEADFKNSLPQSMYH